MSQTFSLTIYYSYFDLDNRENTEIIELNPVTLTHTGGRGRPRKIINPIYLRRALSNRQMVSIAELARILGVCRSTVYRYMKLYSIDRRWSNITDGQLDTLLRAYRLHRPESGLQYIMGFIRKYGLRIQRIRLKEAIVRVDGPRVWVRRRITIKRRHYKVPRPNALWHCDGHHKLIRWGFVIHGFIDGFCRTVSSFDVCLFASGSQSTGGWSAGWHQ